MGRRKKRNFFYRPYPYPRRGCRSGFRSSITAHYQGANNYACLHDTTYLNSLHKKEPAEIVIILESKREELSQVLDNCKSKKDLNQSETILKILDKAFRCESMPNSLNVLYDVIINEEFIKFVVCNFMTNFNRIEIPETVVQESTKYLLAVCRRGFELSTDSLSAKLGNYCLLLKLVSSFHSMQENWKTLSTIEIYEMFTALTETKCSVLRKWIKPCYLDSKRCTFWELDESKDFRKMSIIPKSTRSYVLAEMSHYLKKNKTKGSYDDLEEYLDVHFRLLREDFMIPLRRGLNQYLDTISENHRRERNPDIRVYTNVYIKNSVYKKNLIFTIQFDTTKLKRVNWERTKRLLHGALICLSKDNFKTMHFGTIAERNHLSLKKGKIGVKFECGLRDIHMLDDTRYTMIETNALFESYRHVLHALQRIKKIPFRDNILRCESEIQPPKYLRTESHPAFDLSPLVKKNKVSNVDSNALDTNQIQQIFKPDCEQEKDNCSKHVDILNLQSWPSHDVLSLDMSQFRALQTALTKEIAIIQGPPGTGKTYLGLQIVKVLLKNQQAWSSWIGECNDFESTCNYAQDRRPILIVCYTNHALDQFLEGIIQFCEKGILRVGSRSKSEIVTKHCLFKIRKSASVSVSLGNAIRKSKQEIYYLKRNIAKASAEYDCLKENIVHVEHLIPQTYPVLSELESSYHDKSYKRYNRYGRNEPWFDISGTALWLGLIKKLDEIAKHSDNVGNQKDEGVDAGDNRSHFYDLASESKEFVEDINADISEMIAVRTTNVVNQSHGYSIRKKFIDYLKSQLMSVDIMSDEEEDYFTNDIRTLSTDQRWRLYRKWVHRRLKELEQEIKSKFVKLEKACCRRSELELQIDRELLQNATIIGMTTTCAAKYHMILNEVKPRITIVEEAAEVFESHIIACLNSSCEQMILIGDHKQLRPTPATFEIAHIYHLDVSLFERMVENNLHCDVLQLQHRMRPVIANVVRKIYPDLKDHPSVEKYNDIGGLAVNMYFVNHNHDELYNEEQKSFSNRHEAMFAVALSRYLIQQGYEPSKITILTTYKGQLFLLQNLIKQEMFYHQGLCITVVDNYQGEENDIVILSLVRSNKEGMSGFLKKENRICVALSRGKNGLYVIGNISMLANQSPLWKSIVNCLNDGKLIGERLSLYCQNHPKEKVSVSSYEDFKLAPEGGCQQPCIVRLDCGHTCGRKCHILDSNHENIACRKPCIQRCENGHRCMKRCNDKCGKCTVKIIKTLACGHIKSIECHFDFENYICDDVCGKNLPCGHKCQKRCASDCYPCTVTIKASLLICRHEVELACWQSDIPICEKKCDKKLQCGHICKAVCGANCTDKAQTVYEVKCSLGHQSFCQERCSTTLACKHKCNGKCYDCFGARYHIQCQNRGNCDLVCGHKCESMCGDYFPCERKCKVSCPHGRCHRTCKEPCDVLACEKPCVWECQHFKCTALCGEPCKRPRCNEQCKRKLSCGHMCIGLCGERCPSKCFICNEKFRRSIGLLKTEGPTSRFVELEECGHIVEYKSMDDYMDTKEISVRLKCCPVCTQPIRRSLRYGTIVKDILSEIEKLKKSASLSSTSQDKLTARIKYCNILDIRRTFKRIQNYFACERRGDNCSKSEADETFTAIIYLYEEAIKRRHFYSHQSVLDASLEVKRYFDKNVLLLLQSNLNEIRREIPSEIKTCVVNAGQILDLKSRYDEKNQKLVNKYMSEIKQRLPFVKTSILEVDIARVTDLDTKLLERNSIEKTGSENLDRTQREDSEVIHLQLIIPKIIPYYDCGISQIKPLSKRTRNSNSTSSIDVVEKQTIPSCSKETVDCSNKSEVAETSEKRKSTIVEERNGKKRKTDRDEKGNDKNISDEADTTKKRNRETGESPTLSRRKQAEKRKLETDENEKTGVMKQRKTRDSTEVDDMAVIQSMMKHHENDEVQVQVIDDCSTRKADEVHKHRTEHDHEFLKEFGFPDSVIKPLGLPEIPDIIKDKPRQRSNRHKGHGSEKPTIHGKHRLRKTKCQSDENDGRSNNKDSGSDNICSFQNYSTPKSHSRRNIATGILNKSDLHKDQRISPYLPQIIYRRQPLDCESTSYLGSTVVAKDSVTDEKVIALRKTIDIGQNVEDTDISVPGTTGESAVSKLAPADLRHRLNKKRPIPTVSNTNLNTRDNHNGNDDLRHELTSQAHQSQSSMYNELTLKNNRMDDGLDNPDRIDKEFLWNKATEADNFHDEKHYSTSGGQRKVKLNTPLQRTTSALETDLGNNQEVHERPIIQYDDLL